MDLEASTTRPLSRINIFLISQILNPTTLPLATNGMLSLAAASSSHQSTTSPNPGRADPKMNPPPYTDHHEYKAVPDSDVEEDVVLPELQTKGKDRFTPGPGRRPNFLKRHLSTILIILLTLTVLLLLLAVTAAITLQPIRTAILLRISNSKSTTITTTTNREDLSCGNTTEQAESLGCEYDPLSACWMHPDCPRDYTDEFITYNNGDSFHYYYNHEGTRRIDSWYDLSQLGYYWSSTREHLVHCSFILRRGHDTRARGARVDSMAGDLHHSDHCSEFLADNLGKSREDLEQLGTYGEVGFLSC